MKKYTAKFDWAMADLLTKIEEMKEEEVSFHAETDEDAFELAKKERRKLLLGRNDVTAFPRLISLTNDESKLSWSGDDLDRT